MTVWLVAAPSLFEIQAFEDVDADTKSDWQLSCLWTVCCYIHGVPGTGLHQNGYLLFETHINQIYGRHIKVQGCLLQYKNNTNIYEKQTARTLYVPFIANWSLSTENRFRFHSFFKKKLLDKYIVRLCCVSGCFEAAVFLLFLSTTGQMCIAVGSLCHMVICLV